MKSIKKHEIYANSDSFQQVLMLRFGAHKKGKYLVIFFFSLRVQTTLIFASFCEKI